ncbi:MAG: FkbM family methyltransferase [Solirubrobacteraceae bacterium]
MLVSTLLRGPQVFALRSWLRLLELQKLGRSRGAQGGTVVLTVRRWPDQPLYVRPGGTDWETVHGSLIRGYHRPPLELGRLGTILDLGVNIGVTVADFASHHPEARILGVELDGANVELARRNTAAWRDRVEILHGAAWSEDGEIGYGGDRGEWAYRVVPAMDERTAAQMIDRVPAFSMGTLIEHLEPDGLVDYAKMDIEGAERFVLAAAADDGWATRVRCISVEVHLPLDVAGCSAMLQRLGFRTVVDPSGIPAVVGYR